MSRYRDHRVNAKRDLAALKSLRRTLRDRRRRRSPADLLSYHSTIKARQMSLALHRAGLVSPFDYEYPRLTTMSKMAKAIYYKHVEPAQRAAAAAYNNLHDAP